MRQREGFLHSVQTLGALDGPGLRFVAFLQGCPLRCAYCHNPDTWALSGGKRISADALVEKALRYRPYFGQEGGLTLSGGEPLAQAAFCAEVSKQAHAKGLHVCLDTSGCRMDAEVAALLAHVDLVILDIKHADAAAFRALTGRSMDATLAFLAHCKQRQLPLWIRQVTVPGITDDIGQIDRLAALLRGANVLQTQLLPYHTLGRDKWAKLGIPCPLDGVPAADPQRIAELQAALDRR